ncbi:MAG: hypothetical protein ACLU3I_00595 [Acutalibacteraceae bacterium]
MPQIERLQSSHALYDGIVRRAAADHRGRARPSRSRSPDALDEAGGSVCAAVGAGCESTSDAAADRRRTRSSGGDSAARGLGL